MILARKLVVIFAITLLGHTTGCIVQPFRAEVDWQKTLPTDNLQTIIVDTPNGAIDVHCDPSNEDVQIHAVKVAHGATESEARVKAEEIEIAAVRDADHGHTLRIYAKLPDIRVGQSPSVRFKINLPAAVELRLNSRNGAVTVQGCERDISAETSNGRITVANCRGRLQARTSNGTVAAHDVMGNVDVETCNGRIELERVGDATLRARTTNGGIRILDARGEGEIRSSNGSVEVAYRAVPEKPDIRVITSNGNITLDLPPDVAADLAASTSNGRVRAEMGNTRFHNLDTSRSSLRAKLNDGGGRIDVRSSNGSITLRSSDSWPASPVHEDAKS